MAKSNRKLGPNTMKAMADAYNAQFNKSQNVKDVNMVSKGIDPVKVDNAPPIVKQIVEKVIEDQNNLKRLK